MIVLAAACAGALVGAGVYLLLSPDLQRVVLGFLLLSNGVNLTVLSCARPPPGASAPIVGAGPPPSVDPLPQAFLLTAIVIGLGASAFLLALAVRASRRGADGEGGGPARER